jgi:prostaglandin-E synthase
MAINTAPIKWAQRTDSIYLTISLPDVTEEKIDLKDNSLKFTGKSNGKDYEVDIVFFKSLNAEESTYKVHPRNIQMHLIKIEPEEGEEDGDDDEENFWPRLLKDKALEKNQVKVDWDRYVDEDEEGEGFDLANQAGGQGMGGPPGMGGMGGMPGMEGMGGMPGMGGGMGGMPGMGGGMGGMPGMGGMGGMEGMDMEALMKQMGQMGGGAPGGGDMPDFGDEPDSDDDGDDDEDLPDLTD